MNIVIADDEQLAREAMSDILLEIYPDLQIYEARNGQELIEVVERIKPDAAFVDIRMPGKSGLEAIHEAAPLSPYTQWIILTGFADFAYAKEAIRVGAVDYFLKPVAAEEIHALITRLRQTSLQQIMEKNKLFESDMLSLFHGLILNWDERDNAPQPSCRIRCEIIYMDSCYGEAEKSASGKPFFHTISSTMPKYYHKDLEVATLLLPNGEWAVLGRYTSLEGAEQLQRCFASHAELVRQMEEPGLVMTLIVSDERDSYASLLEEVTTLHKYAYLRCSLGLARSLTHADLYDAAAQPLIPGLCGTAVKSAEEYHRRNYVGYMHTIEQFTTQYESLRNQMSSSTSRAISQFLHVTLQAPLWTSGQGADWLQSLKTLGEKLLDKKIRQAGTTPDLVAKTIAYIEEHYTGDLSLGHIAEELCVTPNHLSSLFHKRTGTTFMQYVTKLRMLKAQELLADPSVQVQQAAEQVGYFSARHFTKLFKEFAGCYPSEYKKQLQASITQIKATESC
ncbi:helix-turn-helix domain-containing protein [Paenibacillus filicis]|uniref:Helix-turn-helix domain-containing protein n=1 Tax=Paenibacillus filicis TaxID=669464 RepID=A0ABU9DP22_9BACL